MTQPEMGAMMPVEVALIAVPFDQDQYLQQMGKAPEALLEAGLVERLAARRVHVGQMVTIEDDLGEGDMLTRLGRLQQRLADAVAGALQAQLLPIVLGGDCCNALGVWRGIERGMPMLTAGVAWFDAHGDWNTEETSLSGYVGGMPYAAICGHGNAGLREAVGIGRPAPEQLCALIGVRDLDVPEKALLDSTGVTVLSSEQAREDYSAAVNALTVIDAFYLHFDVDVLDPGIAPGVTFPTPGGLSVEQAVNIARGLIANKPVVAISLTALNPENDSGGRTVQAALDVLLNVLSD